MIVTKLDWQIAVLSVASAPVTYIAVIISAKYFNPKFRRIRELHSFIGTVTQEVLSNLRVVKAFGTEEREQKRWEDAAWTATRVNWALGIKQNVFWAGSDWVGRLFSRVILVLGAIHVIQGHLTIGELTVILAYSGSISGPLSDIGQTLGTMQYSLVAGDRALEVMDAPLEITDREGCFEIERVDGAVSFEGVTFRYGEGPAVVDDASFDVAPGEVIAIVGPTGAGKTTLASIIARFYDPIEGRVTLDGHDLRDLSIRTLRRNIALVLQEPILFSGSIRSNITYGCPEASLEEVVEAARAANAHDFISALPNGYESVVGERGVRLSGGERQRISVARAFIKDAPVLILDEPTSSIDSRTELVIVEALQRLMVGRTTFIIAHRLSTILDADHILVMDHGRIVERGTHDKLVRAGGVYSQLYEAQTRRRTRRSNRSEVGVGAVG